MASQRRGLVRASGAPLHPVVPSPHDRWPLRAHGRRWARLCSLHAPGPQALCTVRNPVPDRAARWLTSLGLAPARGRAQSDPERQSSGARRLPLRGPLSEAHSLRWRPPRARHARPSVRLPGAPS
eukprot:10136-Lingulodinium_polyedra.AAC.1